MDRNTVVAFVLIGIILMVWMYITAPPPKPPQQLVQDTTSIQTKPDSLKQPAPEITDSLTAQDTLGNYFAPLATGEKKTIFIETELYNAKISSKGGSLKSWELTNFKTWDKLPVNLIDERKGGDFHLLFSTSEGKVVNTKSLYFTTTYTQFQKLKLTGEDSVNVDYVLNINDRSRIIKTLTFYGNKYDVTASYRFENMETIISDFEYQVSWETGMKYAEHNSVDESGFATASLFAGGELTEIDAANIGEEVKQSITGQVSWVGTRNKYFATAIIPRDNVCEGAFIEGNRLAMPDQGVKEDYSIGLRMKFLGKSVESSRFTLFLGPLDFDIIKSYNVELDQMMSLGMAFLIRPISEWFIIPLFQFLNWFIPNYGFVLIVFSIIIKVLLHPLSKSSLQSMSKMQKLQPMITELREKFKDDPQKMNVQIMRLYSEYGVNPAGGCLPMLLQMPILYALWSVFRSTIELRQAEFIWWINDLSIPDVVAKLPFAIPIFGITEVSGLAILMGITMFIQQKMTVQDPRQKMMVWMMPVLMTLLFNSFPSGLNLYYFMFNLLSIAQQEYIKRKHGDEPLKKVDPTKKSKGIIARLAKNLPEMKK